MDREEIAEINPDLLVMDPEYLDEAIVGVVERINFNAVCYDPAKIVELLMKHDGMNEDEAIEYMQFNMMGSYVGEFTPVFLL
jgi:hypothetical protein